MEKKRKKGRRMRRRGDQLYTSRKSRDETKYCYLCLKDINEQSMEKFRELCAKNPKIVSVNKGFKNLIAQCLYDNRFVLSTKMPLPDGNKRYRIYGLPKKVRQAFKEYCKERGVSMNRLLLLLMEEVIHGERSFKRKKSRHVHSYE